MKRVLFIAYYFPPIGGSGVQRSAKFVKYLPQFGWQPHVITTDHSFGNEAWDQTLLKDIPQDVKVWRVPTPTPQPVKRLASWVGWRPAAHEGSASVATAQGSSSAGSRSLPVSIRARRAMLAPLHLIEEPLVDKALYWSLRIVPLAYRIIRQERIDVILTTSAPWSPLVAGALLKRLTLRPWVADFRDPWTDDEKIYLASESRRPLDRSVERRMLTEADAVISVTEPVLNGLQAKLSDTGRRKPFVVIPNGWDRDDLPIEDSISQQDGTRQSEQGHIVLLHPGSTYRGEPIPILEALESLTANANVLRGLQFRFVGYMHPEDRVQIEKSSYVSLFRCKSQRVPHPLAVQMMQEADVLLLLRYEPGASSGKIFEYMVAGRPVLAITPETGVAADLVRRSGIGCVVDTTDVGSLAKVLSHIATDYQSFVTRYYQPNWDVIKQYDRRALAGKLAEVLEHVVLPS